jgi:hypothetical protein
MLRTTVSLFALLLSATVFTQSQTLADEKVIQLFDGKSLAGWTTQSGKPITRGWVVEDGTLYRKSGGGAIYTKDEYGNFDLRFEWKIAKGGNSGIKYRMAFYKKGVRGHPGWLGCEYQVYGDRKAKDRGTHSAAALYDLFPPNDKKELRPADAFNESRIVAHGTHIEHWLNGEKVVEIDTSSDEWKNKISKSKFGIVPDFFKNPKGRIQIQDHGRPVWFRNVTLRVLE